MEELDKILSGKGEAMPEPEKPTPVAEPAEKPAEEAAEPKEGEGGKTVPLEALHAERQKVKRYTEQVADFERRFKESDAAWERRIADLVEKFGPKQEAQAPPEWFENPDAALGYRLKPFESQFQTLESRIMTMERQANLRGSRAENIAAHGREAVAEMEAALQAAVDARDPDIPALQQQVMNSADPVGVAMAWHKRRSILAEIGDGDISTLREKIAAEERAKVQAEMGLTDKQPAKVQTPTMPTPLEAARNVGSRLGPAWAGPMPLGDIFKR